MDEIGNEAKKKRNSKENEKKLEEFRIVSLNCWGLKFVAKKRVIRIQAIADKIVSSYFDYDVVALQEIWVETDFLLVKETILSFFPHSKFYHSAALGGGLAIFSKHPILETNMKPYALNNSPLHILEGDWIVGKGAASAIINHPILHKIEIFNTHFCAGFGEKYEYMQSHRISQAWEICNLIRKSIERGHHVIAVGDFNSTPGSVATDLMNRLAQVTDCWIERNGDYLPLETVESAEMAIKELGVTCNSPLSSWSRGKRFDERSTRWKGKRLDYVFYRNAKGTEEGVKPLHCSDIHVCFTEFIPNQNFSYSDHFGLSATFQLNHKEDKNLEQKDPILPLTSDFCKETASYLKEYKRYAKGVSKGQLIQFFVMDIFAICLVIGSAFQPKPWLNWIFPLVAIPTIWYATTMFYTGFLYGRWEESGLQNTIEEMELTASLVQSEESNLLLTNNERKSGERKRVRQHLSKESESIAPSLCQIQ